MSRSSRPASASHDVRRDERGAQEQEGPRATGDEDGGCDALCASPPGTARRKRGRTGPLRLVGVATERLLGRIVAAADTADEKVLHLHTAPRAVRAGVGVRGAILDFHALVGLEADGTTVEVRRWSAAAGEVRERALETGSEGIGAARRGGEVAMGRIRESAGAARRSAQGLSGRFRSAQSRPEIHAANDADPGPS